ncbi:MAG TPA: hypothetical protein VG676_08810, partial [Chitinophagaceae bacterium]|nr:hypothetical protein [Chitinophagaceae bacterium]
FCQVSVISLSFKTVSFVFKFQITMRQLSKIIAAALPIIIFFLTACNNGEDQSPYDGILSQPPFAPLTDSINKEPERDELYFHRAVLLNKNNLPEPALADFRKAWSLKKKRTICFGHWHYFTR